MQENKEEKKKIENTNTEHKEEKNVFIPECEYIQLTQEAQKSKECMDKMLRLQADLENTRKRMEKEKQDFLKFANEGIIVKLLNVLDDLERAIELAGAGHEDLSAFLKGVEMILAHLYETLKESGVKPIEAEGKLFDPNYHEALMQVEDANFPEHTIVEELQKGYLLNERVIRTSKVKVSKKC